MTLQLKSIRLIWRFSEVNSPQNRRKSKTYENKTSVSCLQRTLLKLNDSLIIKNGKRFINEMLKESKQRAIIHPQQNRIQG